MNKYKITGLIIAVLVIVGAIVFIQSNKGPSGSADPDQGGSAISLDETGLSLEKKADLYPRARKIVNPSGFINTDPISIEENVGDKVILVDFWTYSCINCQRTFPYLRSWWDKYKDDGLLILGIHTPEFSFEKKRENVVKATEKFEINYPVVMDNDYSTWRAYSNNYWPRKYLIDIDGFIVYDHIGEGSYMETEKKIRELLLERAERLGEEVDFSDVSLGLSETSSTDHRKIGTPEIYFGSSRNSKYFANGVGGQNGIQNLTTPESIENNKFYLDGSWDFDREYVENIESGARIKLRYTAKKVNLVAGSESNVSLMIYNDGELVNMVEVQDEGLYTVVENEGYETHDLEIIIEGSGAQIFTFTFG